MLTIAQNNVIEYVIAKIVDGMSYLGCDAQTGFIIEFDSCLEESGVLHKIDINRTSEAHSLIEVRADAACDVPDLEDLSEGLIGAWQSIMYSNFEASSIQCFRECMILRFITAEEYFVTGKVRVFGPNYLRLVEWYERSLSSRRPLPQYSEWLSKQPSTNTIIPA